MTEQCSACGKTRREEPVLLAGRCGRGKLLGKLRDRIYYETYDYSRRKTSDKRRETPNRVLFIPP